MRIVIAAVSACAVVAAIASSTSLGAQAPATPTFSKDVAPILYKNCTNCHRPGEIAPMSLLTYKDARPWARAIREEVSLGKMPPWHADPAHGEFSNDRRLTDADKETIVKWVNAGSLEGDPDDLPPPPTYTDGWMMGEPDIVLAMDEDYPIPADGIVEYKYFEVPTNFTEDRWVQAMEVRPGNRAVVHHVLTYALAPEPPAKRPAAFTFAEGMDVPKDVEESMSKRAPANDRPRPKRQGSIGGGFVPGQAVRNYQPGTAIRIPAGAVLVFQMHYTANGKATTDRTRIGLRLAKEPPRYEVRLSALFNGALEIPAGASNHRVDAEMTA